MALVKCPECQKEISNHADFCPNCGYPYAKKVSKKKFLKKRPDREIIETIDPRFPKVPDKLDIGRPLSSYRSCFNFYGEIDERDNFNTDFLSSCNVSISINENGIMVKELNNFNSYHTLTSISLHYSLIISLKQSDLLQLHISASEERTDKVYLNEAVFCGTIPSVDNTLWDFYREKWQNTTILVINYWNFEFKFIQTIIIRGKLKEINKIIKSYNTAKQNYENEIPNIPDYKGDNKIMRKFLFFSILSVILIIGILIIVIIRTFE